MEWFERSSRGPAWAKYARFARGATRLVILAVLAELGPACRPNPERLARDGGPAREGGSGALPLPPAVFRALVETLDAGEGPTGVLPGPVGACVARAREGLTPELRAALELLSYDDFAQDGCRLALATSARDPSLCERIELAPLARACRTRVAIARGERALCPRAEDEPGPDPLCVALSTRRFNACPAAGVVEGVRCRAIAEGAVERCRSLPGPIRGRCESDLRALDGLWPRAAVIQPAAGSLQLELAWLDGRDPTRMLEASGMDRGAFVTDVRTIVLVDPRRRWPEPTAYALDGRRAPTGVELTLDEGRQGRVLRLRVVLPDGRVFEDLGGSNAGTVRYTRASREVGHELAGTFTVTGAVQGRGARVTGRFETFVRDLVSEREAREGAALPSSSDGGLTP
jgi:hypothetical protein